MHYNDCGSNDVICVRSMGHGLVSTGTSDAVRVEHNERELFATAVMESVSNSTRTTQGWPTVEVNFCVNARVEDL